MASEKPNEIRTFERSGSERGAAGPLAKWEGGEGGGAVVENGVGGGEAGEIEHAFDFALEGADGEVATFAGEGAADHEELAETGAGGVVEAGEIDEEVAGVCVVGDGLEDGVEFLPVVGLDASGDLEDGDGSFVGGDVFGHGRWWVMLKARVCLIWKQEMVRVESEKASVEELKS